MTYLFLNSHHRRFYKPLCVGGMVQHLYDSVEGRSHSIYPITGAVVDSERVDKGQHAVLESVAGGYGGLWCLDTHCRGWKKS